MLKKIHAVAGLVAVGAIGAAGVSLATADGGSQTVDRDALALAVLTEQKGTSAAALLPRGRAGFDADSARVASVASDGTRVIAVRRSDPRVPLGNGELVCVFALPKGPGAVPASGGCTAVDTFDENGVVAYLVEEGSRSEAVVGLVPDGVDAVTVTSESGAVDRVRVENNAFWRPRGTPVDEVSFDGPSGLVTIDAGR